MARLVACALDLGVAHLADAIDEFGEVVHGDQFLSATVSGGALQRSKSSTHLRRAGGHLLDSDHSHCGGCVEAKAERE